MAHTRYMSTWGFDFVEKNLREFNVNLKAKDLSDLPRSFKLFDWVIGVDKRGDILSTWNPTSIFLRGPGCRVGAEENPGKDATLRPLLLMKSYCLSRGEDFGPGFPNAIVAIGDCDTHLGSVENEALPQISL